MMGHNGILNFEFLIQKAELGNLIDNLNLTLCNSELLRVTL